MLWQYANVKHVMELLNVIDATTRQGSHLQRLFRDRRAKRKHSRINRNDFRSSNTARAFTFPAIHPHENL